jgi:hypothetical protein
VAGNVTHPWIDIALILLVDGDPGFVSKSILQRYEKLIPEDRER